MPEPVKRLGVWVRMERHRHLEKLCRRKADGTLWRSSYPDGCELGTFVSEVQAYHRRLYFRRVVRERRWWWFDCWLDTGEVWRPEVGEFQVLDEAEAIPR